MSEANCITLAGRCYFLMDKNSREIFRMGGHSSRSRADWIGGFLLEHMPDGSMRRMILVPGMSYCNHLSDCNFVLVCRALGYQVHFVRHDAFRVV